MVVGWGVPETRESLKDDSGRDFWKRPRGKEGRGIKHPSTVRQNQCTAKELAPGNIRAGCSCQVLYVSHEIS